MAKAVLVLEVDAAAGKAEVKAFGKEFEAALDRIAARAGAVGSQTEAATAKLNAMLHNIPGHVQPAEAAFQSLGLRSSTSIEQARAKITTAYDTIKNSGTASAADVMRAHEAQEKALKKLSDEAMPNFIGKQKAGAASSSEYGASLGKVDEWLNKAGINTGFFGKAIGALVSPVTLAAVAVAGLVAFTSAGVSATVDAVKEAKNLAVVSGLTAEKADNLTGTMKLLGVESGVTQGAMFRLAGEIDAGGPNLARLGVSVRDVNGALKTEGALFLELRDRIAAMGSASERNAALTDIFGRSGRALAGAFALSREEFQKWMDKVGGISSMTDETVKKTSEYTRAVAELEQRFDALKQTVGTGVIPTLTRFLGLLNEALDKAKNPIEITFRLPGPPAMWDYLDALNRPQAPRPPRSAADTQFPESGTALPDQPGRDPRQLDSEIQRDRLVAQARLQAVTRSLDRELAARSTAVALGQELEGNALAADLTALGRRQAATQAYYAELRRLAELRPGADNIAVREVQEQEAAAMNTLLVQRTDLHKRLQVMGREYTTATAEEAIKRTVVERDQAEKTAAFTRDVTAELLTSRIDAFGTEEEKFLRAEQTKLDAFERRQYEQADLDGDYLGAYARVQEEIGNTHQRVQVFIRKQDGETATAHAKALRDSVLATETASEKVQREYREQFNALDHLRANELIGREVFEARVQRLEDETRAKGAQADQAELQRRLAQLTTLNTAKQNEAVLHAAIRAQEQERDAQYFAFLGTQFELAILKGASFYQGLATFASETVASAKSAVSDFFFNFITGTASALEAFEQFGKAVLRSITNLLADQAVTSLWNIAKPVVAAVSAGVGDFLGPALSAVGNLLFHGGGTIGKDGGLRLGTDEFGAVLQRGEHVLSRADVEMIRAAIGPGTGDFSRDLQTALGDTAFRTFRFPRNFLWEDAGEGGRKIGPNTDIYTGVGESPWQVHPLFPNGSAQWEALNRAINAGVLSGGVDPRYLAVAQAGGYVGGGVTASGGSITTSAASPFTGTTGAAFTGMTGTYNLGSVLAGPLITAIANHSPALAARLFGRDASTVALDASNPEFGALGVQGMATRGLLGSAGKSSLLGQLINFAIGMLPGGGLLSTMFTGMNFALQGLTALFTAMGVSPYGGYGVNGSQFSYGANDLNAAITDGQAAKNANIAAGLGLGVFSGNPNVGLGLGGDGGNFSVSAFDRGGIARVHNGEVMTPRPFADEFPALSRALARHDFSRAEEIYGDDGAALGPVRGRRGDGGADVRALVAEVRAMRRELARTVAAVADRPVLVKVGPRTIFETVRDAGKDAVKNGEQWVSQRALYPEKA